MIAYMIKIDSLARRRLCHSLDRQHLLGGSSFIERCMIRQLTNNFKMIWFVICGIILGTKSPSCYIQNYLLNYLFYSIWLYNYLMNNLSGLTVKLCYLFNLDKIYYVKKDRGGPNG